MNFVSIYEMSVLIIIMVFLCTMVLTFKLKQSIEKSSPFECGFDPSGISRIPFCMKFFLICIIFLVFDVEVSLVFPMIYSMYQVISFLLILVSGLFYEWVYGGLKWMV